MFDVGLAQTILFDGLISLKGLVNLSLIWLAYSYGALAQNLWFAHRYGKRCYIGEPGQNHSN